ncbi:MAG: hypothetical protein J6K48_08290 [Lachnospiraceae bacterium]|nr:hypothetical protein [Lachnospiraceae bacterium]
MKFTYKAYKELLMLLIDQGYKFCNYHDYQNYNMSVIIRHDIDMDIEKAVRMAQIEAEMGVTSTYFVLVTSNFYNIFSKENQAMLRKLHELGHEVGLHFDEAKYDGETDLVRAMEQEAVLLEQCIGRPVWSVSMHRPSKKTLEADYLIKGGQIVNSYGTEFFRNHKYVSDSRRNWRENVHAIIRSGKYARLHVLTHPFWYDVEEKTAREALKSFCESRTGTCYGWMQDNVRDLDEILRRSELCL